MSINTICGQEVRPALKAISAKSPKIEESDIALKMPYQYYYFTKDLVDGDELTRLHCYYPKTEVDVTLDLPIYDWSFMVEASWYDKVNDCAYIAINSGGLEIRELTIYKITKKNSVSEEIQLEGYTPRAYNDYDDSLMCYATVDDQFVRIKGYKDGQEIRGLYNFDLSPVTLSTLSNVNLSPLDLGFVRINADGVNIRKAPNAKAPRLGYFYCAECEETDYENPQLWEDDPDGRKPFTPFHPEKGTIYSYPKNQSIIDGWHPLHDSQYVSTKFVDEIIPKPINLNSNIEDDHLCLIKQGKYAGLCIYMTEDGMDEVGMLHFGKIDDGGMIQFYGTCLTPRCQDGINGLKWDEEYDSFYYGKNYENKNITYCFPQPLDLRKLTTADIDLLMSKAKPLEHISMILVDFPDGKQFFFL